MKPEVHVLGLSIKTFGVCFAIGFLAAGAVVARRLRELGKPVDWAYEIVFAALIGGLVGARVYYLAQHWSSVDHDLVGSIFGGSGLVWYGGALGGAAGVLLWSVRRGMFNLTLLDICAGPLALGYAIGRVGCQVSGDGDYGKAWDGPWAMAYPHGTVPTKVTVHPTPIYETLAMGLLAWGLWQLRDRVRPGVVFGIYLVGSGLERFLVEFIRRNDPSTLGLTGPQVESVIAMIAGVAWLVVLSQRGGWTAEPTTA